MNICCMLSILLLFYIYKGFKFYTRYLIQSTQQPDEVSVISILPNSSSPGAYMLLRADRRDTNEQINICNKLSHGYKDCGEKQSKMGG